jgi:hypothetical protein
MKVHTCIVCGKLSENSIPVCPNCSSTDFRAATENELHPVRPVAVFALGKTGTVVDVMTNVFVGVLEPTPRVKEMAYQGTFSW